MFLKYRIDRRQRKIAIKKVVINELRAVHLMYGNSYYTDKYLEAVRIMGELTLKLDRLEWGE